MSKLKKPIYVRVKKQLTDYKLTNNYWQNITNSQRIFVFKIINITRHWAKTVCIVWWDM